MRRKAARRAFAPGGLALLFASNVSSNFACSSPAKPQGQGGTCFQVTDCAPGLVCVPASASFVDGPRQCSSDTSPLVHAEVSGEAGAPHRPGLDGGGAPLDSSDDAFGD